MLKINEHTTAKPLLTTLLTAGANINISLSFKSSADQTNRQRNPDTDIYLFAQHMH